MIDKSKELCKLFMIHFDLELNFGSADMCSNRVTILAAGDLLIFSWNL